MPLDPTSNDLQLPDLAAGAPLGTPPLVDRVPRNADGAPLLTRDCPVSSMLFCDDYAARCVRQAEAPRHPDYCDDVSQYRARDNS